MKTHVYNDDEIIKLYDNNQHTNIPFSGPNHRQLNYAFFKSRYVHDPATNEIYYNDRFHKKQIPLQDIGQESAYTDNYLSNAGAIQLFDRDGKAVPNTAISGMSGKIFSDKKDKRGNRIPTAYGDTERNMIRDLLEKLLSTQGEVREGDVRRPSSYGLNERGERKRDYDLEVARGVRDNITGYKRYLTRFDQNDPGSGQNTVKMWSERKRCEHCGPFTNAITPDESEIGSFVDSAEVPPSTIKYPSMKFAEAYAKKLFPKYTSVIPPILSDNLGFNYDSDSSSEDFPMYTPQILPSPGPAEMGFGYGLPNVPLHLQIGNVFDAYAPQRGRGRARSPAFDQMTIDSGSERSRSRSRSSSSTSSL